MKSEWLEPATFPWLLKGQGIAVAQPTFRAVVLMNHHFQ